MSSFRFAAGVLPAFIAVLVLAAGCSRPPPAPEPVRAVRTLVVAAGTAEGTATYAAEVRARSESRLGFRVGGKLVQRPAEVGQTVRAGQLLALLDPQDLRLAQDAARAAMQAAQVSARQAEADLARFKGLHAQGFISDAELQRRESAALAALAQLAQAAAQADAQRNLAGYSELRAPAAGVVTAVEAEPGTVLAAGAPVLRLAHAGPRDAVFALPEDALAGVRALLGRAGALAVRLSGAEAPVPATLREIAAAADPVTRTFQAKADLGPARAELGQTASVTVVQAQTPGVLRLPLTALLEQQGRTVVWVLDPATMTVRRQPVQLAGTDGPDVLVAAGLAPGAEVVTAGVHVLDEGQQVTRFAPSAVPSAVPAVALPPAAASQPAAPASR